MAESPQRVAVIDVGSNSTRLLVADVDGGGSAGERQSQVTAGERGQVTVHERQSRVTRLGRGVDLSGQLADEAIEAACAAIADYVEICRELGAERVAAIATSAVRDASNGAAFVAELRERFALSARVLDGEEEARLTYRGATAEREALSPTSAGAAPTSPTLVIDIGGGSTEMVVGAGEEIGFHTSLQAGVVRHTERHISGDPPTAVELEALAGDVRGLIEASLTHSAVPYPPITRIRNSGTTGAVAAGIAVAGTPTSLAAVELGLEPYDPARVHGHVLSLETIQRLLSRFASAPLAERAAIPGLHPDRAPTIIAGCVILIEAMRAFGLDRIEASEHDILYGVALETAATHNGQSP
jgi:exopolyphosphatase/guanosine-5'-triphosphate,3'-diphosphate pyrophosphatase